MANGSSNAIRRPVVEPIVEPDRLIVDPHHHLWQRDFDYLASDLVSDLASGHNVRATVYVQCETAYDFDAPEVMRPVGEARFVAAQAAAAAARDPRWAHVCAGFVGHVDLTAGEAIEAVLDAEAEASGGRLCGIRHIVASDEDNLIGRVRARAGLMDEPAFRQGLQRLAARNLVFDAWLYHPQLPALKRLAQAVPDATIVLDHMGAPLGVGTFAGHEFETRTAWTASLRDLADCPNVRVKLGGLGMPLFGLGFETHAEGPSSDTMVPIWRPYIETCLKLFGARRCMFESNFPVDRVSVDYPVLWNTFKKIAMNFSESEKADLFVQTAIATYDLPQAIAKPARS